MKRAIIIGVALLALAAAGWSALWHVVAGKVEEGLDRWIAREAAAGRVWTCPERRVDGFPKQIQVTCANPAFQGRLGGRQASGRLGTLIALGRVTDPNRVLFDLQGPLTAEYEDGRALELNWSALRVILGRAGTSLDNATFVIEDARLSATGLPAPLAAERVQADLKANPRLDPATNASDGGYALYLRVVGGAFAPLDRLLPATAPIEIETQGRLTRGEAMAAHGAWPARLEAWRQASGQLDVTKFIARRVFARIDGTAILALDEYHRLAGSADLNATGLDDALKAMGAPTAALEIGGALGALLGGRRATQAGPAQPGGPTVAPTKSIPMPLRFERGAIFWGPLRLPVYLAPLY